MYPLFNYQNIHFQLTAKNDEEKDVEPVVKNETLNSVGTLENSEIVPNCGIKRRRISESSSSSLESVRNQESKNQLSSEQIAEKQDWKKEYRKTFVCRMCNSHCFSLKSVEKHKAKHRYLKSKHADVLSAYCYVALTKIDSKPNITGSMDRVVFGKNKIIAKGNADYYIAYNYIGKYSTNTKVLVSEDNESIHQNEDNLEEDSDTSFKNNVLENSQQRRKRRRICSRSSSSETVVLENKSMGKSQENECISIDDTDSDDGSKNKLKTNKTSKNLLNAKLGAVTKLIHTTHNKYLIKLEKPEKPSLEQLNRKIISIGRQIINKRNFNSSRVTKYMDHLNLNVIWLSRTPQSVTNNSNYFKIIPRLRYPNEKNVTDFAGYHKKYDKPIEINKTIEATVVKHTSLVKKSKVDSETSIPGVVRGVPSVVGKSSATVKSELIGDANVLEKPSVVGKSRVVEESSVGEHTLATAASRQEELLGRQYAESIHTVSLIANVKRGLNDSHNTLHSETRKLLNSNPVANPKQLPKKFISDAQKEKAKFAANMPTLEVNVNELSEMTSSGFENNMRMPVITCTTSLAVSQENGESSTKVVVDTMSSTPVNSISETPKQAPRIKVKSVTELMSTETLNRMKQPSAPRSLNEQMPQNGATSSVHSTNNKSVNPPTYDCEDYITLDTVELPNTKTSSPFKYFRTLLQVHNLCLLDTDVTLSADFNTLIKFKVLYRQENKDEPVVLCLSLFCSNNTFCMKIKDRNEDNINMTKISANWQWEILKIYRGEVVAKMLNNAQKISSEVREYTNRFLCLLKSLNKL